MNVYNKHLITIFALCGTLGMSAATPFQQQNPGTEDKWKDSETDLYEPLQWDQRKIPGDGDSLQLAAYCADKRFFLSKDQSTVFDTLYFKTGHTAVDTTGSVLSFDTRSFSLLIPSTAEPTSSRLLWQTYVPADRAFPQADYTVMSLTRGNGGASSVAAVRLKDFAFRQVADVEFTTTVAFTRGTFDAFDPEGVGPEPDSADVYTLRLAQSALTSTFRFDPGVVVKVPRLEIMNGGPSTVIVDGAAIHANGSFWQRGTTLAANGATITVGLLGGDGYGDFTHQAGSFTLSGKLSGLQTKRHLTINGGTFTNDAATINVGGDFMNNNTAMYVQCGGKLTVAGHYLPSGNSILRLASGRIEIKDGYGLYQKSGSIFIEDGVLIAQRIRWGGDTSSADLSEIVQSGGVITLDGATRPGLWMCEGGIRPCRLALLGGELRTPTVCAMKSVLKGGAGTASFLGDGGRLVATSSAPVDNAPFFGGIDEAQIGVKGFTLDTQSYDVLVEQDFTNEADSSGVLLKAGVGELAYSGICTVSAVKIQEGTFRLATAATRVESSLTLERGSSLSLVGEATVVELESLTARGAVIRLDPGDEIVVNGALDLKNVSLAWSSEPTEFVSFLSVAGKLSDASQTAIRGLYLADATDRHVEFAFDYDATTGKTSVKARVAANVPLAETAVWTGAGDWVDTANWEGTVLPTAQRTAVFGPEASEHGAIVKEGAVAGALSFVGGAYRLSGASSVLLHGVDGAAQIAVTKGTAEIACGLDLLANVNVPLAAGTSLELAGLVSGGGLVKTGAGCLTLGGTLATHRGFVSREGRVRVTSTTGLGIATDDSVTMGGGTVEFQTAGGMDMSVSAHVRTATSAEQNAVVYQTETDVTFEDFGTTQGFVVKRGKGTMTVAVPPGRTVTLTKNVAPIGQKDMYTADEGIGFPADGSEPTGMRGPLSVVEGELRIVGRGQGAHVVSPGTTYVTVPTAEAITAQPMLTVENVEMECGNLYNGWCLGRAPFTPKTSVIRVLNGATLRYTGSMPGYACLVSGCTATYAVTNATLDFAADGGYLTRGRLDGEGTEPLVRYQLNGSEFFVGSSAVLDGSVFMDLDNSSYYGRIASDAPTTSFAFGTGARVYGEIFTRNGSRLALRPFVAADGQTRDLTLAFDNGEWQWSDNGGDDTVESSEHVRYEMRGTGVVLKPMVGRMLTLRAPFEGEGGLVLDGPGTVKMDIGAFAFTGTADIRHGLLDLSSAGTLEGKAFAGNGTIVGGELLRPRLVLALSDDWANTNGVPTFADCTFEGRVTVSSGRDEEDVLDLPDVRRPTAIAKVSGTTTVDLRRWKFGKTGVDEAAIGAFTQVGDTIYLTPANRRGLSVNLR